MKIGRNEECTCYKYEEHEWAEDTCQLHQYLGSKMKQHPSISLSQLSIRLEGNGGKMLTTGNSPLGRQSYVYSLTFDELQNTFGEVGEDFGSMNMADLLKNICTAEENQAFRSSARAGNGVVPSGNLRRQGCLMLPKTLNQKTVDEVWRGIYKESTTGTDGGDFSGGSGVGQRQTTLGEMTIEEFLMRAGVAKEDPQQPVKRIVAGVYGALAQPCSSSSGLSIGFQPVLNQNVHGNQFLESRNQVPNSSNIILNWGGMEISRKEQHREAQLQQQSLFTNEASVTFSSSVPPGNDHDQITNPRTKAPVVAKSNFSLNSTSVQDGAACLSGSRNLPASDVGAMYPGNNMSSAYPLYTGCESGRGRRSNGSLEKGIERRHKRKMKNRESAARSRARKQAYNLELEEEVAKLKKINKDLWKQTEELMEMDKDKMLTIPCQGKIRCLQRTLSAPW